MPDRIHCLSDTAEPGLVRMVHRRDAEMRNGGGFVGSVSAPGETVEWSLDVENAQAAIAALDRSMGWYRKNRGDGVYRCSPKDAWSVTMRHCVSRRRNGRLSGFDVTDTLLSGFLAISLVSGILAMQVAEMSTAKSMSITAVVLAMLTVCLTFARDRRDR